MSVHIQLSAKIIPVHHHHHQLGWLAGSLHQSVELQSMLFAMCKLNGLQLLFNLNFTALYVSRQQQRAEQAAKEAAAAVVKIFHIYGYKIIQAAAEKESLQVITISLSCHLSVLLFLNLLISTNTPNNRRAWWWLFACRARVIATNRF